jgi:carbon monoxide dehydrogenase subunit G
MLRFEGYREVARSLPEVLQKLSEPHFLVQCVPDVESVAQIEPTQAVCIIRPGLSFVRGTLTLTVQVAEVNPEGGVRLLLHTKGIGSTSDVEAILMLAPQDSGTQIHWIALVKNLGGLLKAVPQGLIKAAAQKVIDDVWQSVQVKLMG